jgi:hypothetical protein
MIHTIGRGAAAINVNRRVDRYCAEQEDRLAEQRCPENRGCHRTAEPIDERHEQPDGHPLLGFN